MNKEIYTVGYRIYANKLGVRFVCCCGGERLTALSPVNISRSDLLA